ncbi:hypothetical protein Tco_1384646 [Tanacetum coccineum]
MASSHQQSIADAGLENRPPMLKKGNYVPWASRFMRYVDGKKEHGRMVKDSIDNGPYVMKQITDPTSPTDAPRTKIQTVADLTGNDKLRYEADIDTMNWILLGIPNDIYNSVDACQNAKAMWNQVKRLIQGTDLSLQERYSRLMNEFDKFSAEDGESLESVYERFSTLMNNMERNKLLPDKIATNAKFLNSLQPEYEPNVNASRVKRTARNSDPLAIVANTYASASYSRPSQSYYITRPHSVQDYDDDY